MAFQNYIRYLTEKKLGFNLINRIKALLIAAPAKDVAVLEELICYFKLKRVTYPHNSKKAHYKRVFLVIVLCFCNFA